MAISSAAYEGDSFQKFLSLTNEKQILGNEILNLIEPTYKSLLEVGAGNGDLTEYYLNKFETAVLIEPAQQFYENLKYRFPNRKIVHVKIEEFKSEQVSFDLIVASHVFIYFEHPFNILEYLFSILKKRGKFVIIMVNRDCGYLKFVDRFSEEIIQNFSERAEFRWEDLILYMSKRGMTYEVKDITSFITCFTINDFLSMNDFHFTISRWSL